MAIIGKTKTIIHLLILSFLIGALPLTLYLAQRPQEYRGKAALTPVVLSVDAGEATNLLPIWQNLAQGGEVPIPQLPPVLGEIRELSPAYIRIDHVFDLYKVVRRDESGQVTYDFSLLDKDVDAILSVGAKPFLSLSYIPSDLADPANSNRPASYTLWEELVSQTVSHFSGKYAKNIADVFYEVYNEPDLFGKWDVYAYAQLYETSLKGAQEALDVNTFFFGGPAISYFDRNFIDTFLRIAEKENLRVDFVSWHTYSPVPTKIAQDANTLSVILADKPSLRSVRKVVSEWGSIPAKHFWHDSSIDAAHLVATVSKALGIVDMLFYFEIKDGEQNEGDPLGGWGILRNEALGFAKKPRFYALLLLNKLNPLQYPVAGESEHVFAIASGSQNKESLSVTLANYSSVRESVILPTEIMFTHLLPGTYEVKKTVLKDTESPSQALEESLLVPKDTATVSLELFPDSVVNVNLRRMSSALELTNGESDDASDKAAKITPLTSPLLYKIPQQNGNVTEIGFSIKPDGDVVSDAAYFESSSSASFIRLARERKGFTPVLGLSVTDDQGLLSYVSLPLPSNDSDRWHKIRLVFDNQRALLSLSYDGIEAFETLRSSVALDGDVSFVGNATQFLGAIDAIAISVDQKPVLLENF